MKPRGREGELKKLIVSVFVFSILNAGVSAESNWPQWRGPNLNGTVQAQNLPLRWSETENIVWKVPLPSWSGSTPAVWGDRIFLMSPEPSRAENPHVLGERRGGQAYNGGKIYSTGYKDPGGEALNLHCLDRADGTTLWVREVDRGNRKGLKQNMSSPSPLTDGRMVWAMTGNGVLTAFDFEGTEIWTRDIPADYGKLGHGHGYGATPLLYRDRLIVPVLHGSRTDEPSYLLAVDKATGKTLWRTERPTDAIGESPDSYATPQLLILDSGPEVIINGGDLITGHDPIGGAELWRSGGLNPTNMNWNRMISSCVVTPDIIFVPTRVKPMIALRTGGRGDITATHLAWKIDRGGPDVPTPVSDGRFLWIIDDRGVTRCVDILTGEDQYRPQRIATGTYSSSPILAGSRIYATTEDAVTTVLAATPEFEILATNRLEDPYTLSTIAIAGDRIYLRASQNLYCIAELGQAD